jgi:hypothetical protein
MPISRQMLFVAASLLLPVHSGFAQAVYVSVGGGAAIGGEGDPLFDKYAGFRFALGVSARLGPVLVNLYPVDLVSDPDFSKSSLYSRDTFSNGQSRCRSSSDGRFVSDSLCSSDNRTLHSTTIDVAAWLPRIPIVLGVGKRFVHGNIVDPWFATAGLALFPADSPVAISARAELGPSYRGWLITAAFRFAHHE